VAELKTQPNSASVAEFLDRVGDPQQRKDAKTLLKLMSEVTGHRPRMWGNSIIGFGQWHYKYGSGREGDWFVIGFSPRKRALTLYMMCDRRLLAAELARLGQHNTGVGCVYIRRLSDVDPDVLRQLLERAVASVRKC
jgi:Domain of unknown function (DU1801)